MIFHAKSLRKWYFWGFCCNITYRNLGLIGNLVYSYTVDFISSVTIDNLMVGKEYLLLLACDSHNGSNTAVTNVDISSAYGCTYSLIATHNARFYGAAKVYLIKAENSIISLNSQGDTFWYLFE